AMTTVERLDLLHRVASAEAGSAHVESISRDGCESQCANRRNDRTSEAMPLESFPLTPRDEEPVKTGVADLVELILKRRDRLERLIREPSLQSVLLPKFLAIALIGFVFFGVAMSLVFTSAGQWPRLIAIRDIVA